MNETIIEFLTCEIVAVVRTPSLALGALPSPGPIGPAVQALQDAVGDINNTGNVVAWASRVRDWTDRLGDLADAAMGGPNASDALLVRFLQERVPRLAAVFALAGVITPADDQGRQRIDRERLKSFWSDPGVIFNEQLWNELLGDVAGDEVGRQIVILLALVILFPQTIIALIHGDIDVQGLMPPATRAPGLWRDFRDATATWLSLTLPLPDPSATSPSPASLYDLVPGLDPDFAVTLAGRATRTGPSGNRQTDFEAWLAITIDNDVWEYDFGNGWKLRVEPGITAGFGRIGGVWHGGFRALGGDPNFLPAASEPWRLSIRRDAPPDEPDILLGPPYDTRLEIRDLEIFLEIRGETPVVRLGMDILGFALVLTNRWWRTWGETFSFLPNGIRYDADLRWSVGEGEGFRVNLASTLDVKFGLNRQLGKDGSTNIKLHSIRLIGPIDVANGELRWRAEVRAHASVGLGRCVTIVVDGFGAWGGSWKNNLGDANEAFDHFGFLPPTGAGLEIRAGPVVAGGFISYVELPGGGERYSGALSCLISGIGAHAFAIYERDADNNRSAVVVLGIRFGLPGIQLGFGFALSGVGGLIGIDRRMDVDALRERLTSGAAGNVLFLEDPIRNAPAILEDLQAIFPTRQGVIVIGPTVQINWLGGFAKLDVGVIFEVRDGSLTKIVIIGSVRCLIGENFGFSKEEPMLHLRADFLGVIDFVKALVEFDGTIINSKAFGTFVLTGDAAFRSKLRGDGYVLLTLGGFHPSYQTPSQIILPELTRVALTLTPGTFSAGYHFRAEAYLAFTPNTFQVGGAVEVGLAAGPLNISGILGVDILIQYTPFRFDILIFFAARIRWKSKTLAGIRVEGSLFGPGPTKLRGRACIEILFFDICKTGTITIGSEQQPAVPAVATIVSALASELDDPRNVAAIGRADQLVVAAESDADLDRALISPIGELEWRQRRAPLDLEIERFEGVRLTAPQAVIAESSSSTRTVRELFSPGSFLDLTESEQLNLNTFVSHDAGLQLGFAMTETAERRRTVEIITYTLPRPVPIVLIAIALPIFIAESVASRTAAPRVAVANTIVAVDDETFDVVAQDGTLLAGDRTETDAYLRARGSGGAAVARADIIDIGGF